MKVNRDNTVIYMGNDASAKAPKGAENKKGQAVVFAGDLAITSDRIEEKRRLAQRQALRIVGEVYDNDKKIDEDLAARRERINEIKQELSDINTEINRIDGLKEDLRESMCVDPESEEQKDLELLEKSYFDLTEEERERVAEIRKDGLTDYQTQALEYNKAKSYWGKCKSDLEKEMIEENYIVEATKRELVKNTGMIEAEKQADDVMEAASKEIQGMLVEDMKEHIEEEEEKKKEEAEKLEEAKKEKEQTRAEKRQEEAEELLDITMDTEMVAKEIDVKQKIQDIVNEVKLNIEDIMGTTVDVNI